MGFTGRIHPINPKATEIAGLKAYPSLASVPDPIDLVIVSVPAPAVPAVLEDCIVAGAKNIHIFTAGFEETGEPEGEELGRRIREIAHRGGLRVVGPNCMGLYVPSANLAYWPEGCTESGPVAFLSQSGRLAQDWAEYAQGYGVRFSKVISYGNALTLDCTDFLEYLATDPETKIIGMYLEGVRDGQKFARQVKEINRQKPVIVWKGGLTEPGSRAVASHTGALGGEGAIWSAFFKQTGAIRADSLEEIADLTMTFLYLKPPGGRRVALMGVGGGISVASADICAWEGFQVPTLTAKTRRELRGFVPPAGNSIRNPLDIAVALLNPTNFERTLELIANDPLIDVLLIGRHWFMTRYGPPDMHQKLTEVLIRFAKRNNKPLVVALQTYTDDPEVRSKQTKIRAELLGAGIPVYDSQQRASRALAKFIQYHEFYKTES